MMMTTLAVAVDPEDREIIGKLARLQEMYSQIDGLRSLLPEKLINPARVALENPRICDPEQLATYLQSAAKAGSLDVERFKRDWHSDDVRELWQAVHANDLPQGGDAWSLNYGGLLQDDATKQEPFTRADETGRPVQPPNDVETATLVEDFCVRHPELKVHVSDGPTKLPIDIQVAGLDFRIEETQSSGGGNEYNVIGQPGTHTSHLRHDILQSIAESQNNVELASLLETIASYRDIKTEPCHKCHKLFDSKTLDLPLVRHLQSPQKDPTPRYLAAHRNCKS